jgi:probable HAF family extracellular repeat protein
MQSRIAVCFATLFAFASLASPALLSAQAASTSSPPQYYVFNLGAPGGISAAAASINNAGWIAGDNFISATTQHAELWIGVPVDLGTLGGANSAVAWPNKNTRGKIVGITETADVNPLGEDWSCALANFAFPPTQHICYGFLWQDGAMTPLLPLPGGLDSYGASINNRGQAVGWAENGVHETTCTLPQVLQFEAVIWGPASGQMTVLPPLSGDLDGAATAINNDGDVVGISGICDQAAGRYSAKHAVLWHNGHPVNLGNFDGGVAWNTPTAINNRDEVAGFANLPNTPSGELNPVGFLWTRQHGIRQVQVVGDSCVDNTFSSCRAYIYQDGMSTDLNTLIQSNSSLSLILANDINDHGEIAGFALDTSSNLIVAFRAVPVNDRTEASTRTESRRTVLPDNMRSQLPGLSRFASRK